MQASVQGHFIIRDERSGLAGLLLNNPTGGELHPHNQTEVLEVLRGPSNLRWTMEKCIAFFWVLVCGLRETVVSVKFWVPAFWSTFEGFRAEIADVCF